MTSTAAHVAALLDLVGQPQEPTPDPIRLGPEVETLVHAALTRDAVEAVRVVTEPAGGHHRPPGAIDDGELGWHLPDLSAFELHLVVDGRPVVKKNNMTVKRFGGHSSIGPKSIYANWEKAAVRQLAAQWRAVFREPIPAGVAINLRVLTYLPDRRGWPDLSATYEGPQDALQGGHGAKGVGLVIVDDKWVCGHDGSARLVDAGRPRVELTLTPSETQVEHPAPKQREMEFTR